MNLYLFSFNLSSYNHHFNLIISKSFHMLNFYRLNLIHHQVYDLDNILRLHFLNIQYILLITLISFKILLFHWLTYLFLLYNLHYIQ